MLGLFIPVKSRSLKYVSITLWLAFDDLQIGQSRHRNVQNELGIAAMEHIPVQYINELLSLIEAVGRVCWWDVLIQNQIPDSLVN